MNKPKHIVLGVTGSIAAYKSADIIRRLQEKGFMISVIMTEEAEKFITPLTLGALSGQKVYRAMFDERDGDWQMNHIRLAKEADLILVAPATANVIGKIAAGLANDLLTCSVLASQAQIILAPAMNSQMFENKIVQENCKKLKSLGYRFIEPTKGKLACGDFGDGHLAEVEDIVGEVLKFFSATKRGGK